MALLCKVGVEPTGDPFNSIIRLDENSKRPDNPMVNAGAIATTSLINGENLSDRLNRILAMFEDYPDSCDRSSIRSRSSQHHVHLRDV